MASGRLSASLAILLYISAVYAQRPRPDRPPEPASGPPPPVGGISPFTAGCNGTNQQGSVYLNSADEPYLAVDPSNPQHLVGVWQQNRWTTGGADGLMSAVSMNGGRTWSSSSAHFSMCSGGTYERASDPWS